MFDGRMQQTWQVASFLGYWTLSPWSAKVTPEKINPWENRGDVSGLPGMRVTKHNLAAIAMAFGAKT